MAVACLLVLSSGDPCRGALPESSLDAVLSCLETNGLVVDRSLAVKGGLEGILKAIDPGAIVGGEIPAGEVDAGSTQPVHAVEFWPEDIAYVKIRDLAKGRGIEILTQLHSLTRQAGIILDLRGVAGNDPGVVSCLAGLTRPEPEPLFILTDNHGQCLSTNIVESGASIPVPLMVLVDRNTRAAAEALAALWRGRPGIMLIGSTTGGDTRFRDSVRLPSGQMITLATRKLVLLHGDSYEGRGITPDVVVTGSPAAGNARLFDTNIPARALSAKSGRDLDLMRRVDGDAVLQRATDILLGLRTLGCHGQ